jgi:hypothetical protein
VDISINGSGSYLPPLHGELQGITCPDLRHVYVEAEHRGVRRWRSSRTAVSPQRPSPSRTDWMTMGTCGLSNATSKRRVTSTTSAASTAARGACFSIPSTPWLGIARDRIQAKRIVHRHTTIDVNTCSTVVHQCRDLATQCQFHHRVLAHRSTAHLSGVPTPPISGCDCLRCAFCTDRAHVPK